MILETMVSPSPAPPVADSRCRSHTPATGRSPSRRADVSAPHTRPHSSGPTSVTAGYSRPAKQELPPATGAAGQGHRLRQSKVEDHGIILFAMRQLAALLAIGRAVHGISGAARRRGEFPGKYRFIFYNRDPQCDLYCVVPMNLKTAIGDPLSPFRHWAASSYDETGCHHEGEVRGGGNSGSFQLVGPLTAAPTAGFRMNAV